MDAGPLRSAQEGLIQETLYLLAEHLETVLALHAHGEVEDKREHRRVLQREVLVPRMCRRSPAHKLCNLNARQLWLLPAREGAEQGTRRRA